MPECSTTARKYLTWVFEDFFPLRSLIHEIRYPDSSAGDELRTIVWDDVAGTVEGDHVLVREGLLSPDGPNMVGTPAGVTYLDDPMYLPEEFLLLLAVSYRGGEDLHPRAILPDSLKNVTPNDCASSPFPTTQLVSTRHRLWEVSQKALLRSSTAGMDPLFRPERLPETVGCANSTCFRTVPGRSR